MHNKYEAILFDLGNVVFKIHFERCFQHWAQVTGKSQIEIAKKFVFDDMYAAHEVAEITGIQYHAHVSKLIDADISFKEFTYGWNAIFGNTIPETLDLIRDLKSKYKIFGFTNSNLLHRPLWSEKYKNALSTFDNIFCSSQLKLRKPNPDAFAKICSETEIKKEHFILVDDLEENVLGGSQFGFSTVLFSDPVVSTNKVRSLAFG
jgi:putative hydrolase of the HAD superfamily